MVGFQLFPLAIPRVFQTIAQILYHFDRNRFASRRRISFVNHRFPHASPNAFQTIIHEVQKTATLVGQIIPADNVQVIEEVKQTIPAGNVGTDRLIQSLFCRGSAEHRNSIIELIANARGRKPAVAVSRYHRQPNQRQTQTRWSFFIRSIIRMARSSSVL